jgi:hypothetical protein
MFMMKFTLLSTLMLSFISSSLFAGELAGKADFVSGEVTVIQDDGDKHALHMGGTISTGDTLVSGPNSEAHLRMEDDAYLALRANSRVVIKSYQALNKDSDNSTLQLLRGSLRIVTGWIGQKYSRNYRVTTPTASIGVRGTDHEPLYIAPEEATEAQPAGTYDHVVEGSTVINNEQGQIDVDSNYVGFIPLLGKPRLLPRLPEFFPRGSFDQRINEIKPLLKKRIQEKMELLEQQRLKLEQKRLQLREEVRNHRPVLPGFSGLPNLPGR